jgi:hypothetical protein
MPAHSKRRYEIFAAADHLRGTMWLRRFHGKSVASNVIGQSSDRRIGFIQFETVVRAVLPEPGEHTVPGGHLFGGRDVGHSKHHRVDPVARSR